MEAGGRILERKNLELTKHLRHELHQHPELSNQETWTKQHLMSFLQTHTCLEIIDKAFWFYAVYRAGEGQRNIAFRADFDADFVNRNETAISGL